MHGEKSNYLSIIQRSIGGKIFTNIVRLIIFLYVYKILFYYYFFVYKILKLSP